MATKKKSDQPAPHPSGYQPVEGEGFAYIDIEVRPSQEFQTVGATGRLVFPQPRPYTEVLEAFEDAYELLEARALDKVAHLIELREQGEQAKVSKAVSRPAPKPVPKKEQETPGLTPEFNGWQIGTKPAGKGTFKFLPTSVVSIARLKEQATDMLVSEGFPGDELIVFDNRPDNGDRSGLESGGRAYSVGVVAARRDTNLGNILGDRRYIANVDFDNDGRIKVNLTKEGQAAKHALVLTGGAY